MPHNSTLLPSYSKDHYRDEDGDGKFRKPKSYHPLPSPSSTNLRRRLPTILLLSFSALCLVVGVAGIAFASTALRRPPRIATVFRCGRDEDAFRTYRSKYLAAAADGKEEDSVAASRPKVLGLVGIYTGFSAADRRAALRSTWFPADPDALLRLEHATGLTFRFAIGQTKDPKKKADLQNEMETYHDFMTIDVDEDDLKLPHKMLAFFKAAFNLFDAEYYVKIDDNIYLRPDRLSILLAKDREHRLTYIGCMTKGPVITDPKMKWYESSGHLIGNEYFLHAYGPIYILSAQVVQVLANAKNDSLRMFSNEDITVGSWMLSMNVNHEDNKALCHTKCTPTSIAVWDMPKCSGLCSPVERMAELHSATMCSGSPTMSSEEEEEK